MPNPNKQVQRKRMMGYFIKAAEELIEEEGVENITIRKVASKAAYNSATIYNYFEDLDHLLYFALIKYTKKYVLSLSSVVRPGLSPMEIYIRVWERFCDHAFANPYCFFHLFFTQKEGLFSQVLHEYYEIFPEELENQSEAVLDMISESNIFNRNRKLLRAIWSDEAVSDEQITTMNNLLVNAFHGMLENQLKGLDKRPANEIGDEMMRMVRLVNKTAPEPDVFPEN